MKADMPSYLDPRSLAASVSLCAGEAHGVRVVGIYKIHRRNLRGAPDVSKLGSLKVLRLDDDDIMATHGDSDVDFQIPSFFYGIEEDCYFDPINICIPGDTETEDLDTLCGWTNGTEKEEGES
jgi:hypothetical protein